MIPREMGMASAQTTELSKALPEKTTKEQRSHGKESPEKKLRGSSRSRKCPGQSEKQK